MLHFNFINDLSDSISHSTLKIFADNCLLYKTIRSLDAVDLEQDLVPMQTWPDAWLTKFNISKCFVMRVTQYRKYKVLYDYQLYISIVNSVDHCKNLGITLQSNLQWSKHIEEITAKADSTFGIICRNIRNASIPVKTQIYPYHRICFICLVTVAGTGHP